MKILYFSRDYTPHDHRFLAALAETEHEVYFLRLERRGHAQEERPLPAGIRAVKWAGGTRPAMLADGPRLLASLRRVLKGIRPDVVHAGPIQTCALLAALAGARPLVSMSWGSDLMLDAEKNKRTLWATRRVFKKSSVLLCDNEAVRARAIALGMDAGRVVTFPWGVDLAHFSPEGGDGGLRQRAGWEDCFVILHTRTWEPVYGVDVMARGFALAASQRDDLRLLMPGNGSLAGRIKQILMGAGVIDWVRFAGQVRYEELPQVYRSADLYVSSSHSDGSSVSLMEALACGVPALVSYIPGNREWVTPDVGWQFRDGDAEALARGILHAAEGRDMLKKMGAAARAKAEQKANWETNFKTLLGAYEQGTQK
ncbi:MAG: glycosyltransferase family 1 protein [Anaerolineae bacterium]|nr:MAG: glycosyltransferase family 1 protein [Anaerolineae bacterium]